MRAVNTATGRSNPKSWNGSSKRGVWPRREKIGDIDASIVTDHMMLCAASLGLDTLWICMFKPEAVRAEFRLPDHVEPVNILLIGYGSGEPSSPDRHDTLRKPLSETVFEETF